MDYSHLQNINSALHNAEIKWKDFEVSVPTLQTIHLQDEDFHAFIYAKFNPVLNEASIEIDGNADILDIEFVSNDKIIVNAVYIVAKMIKLREINAVLPVLEIVEENEFYAK